MLASFEDSCHICFVWWPCRPTLGNTAGDVWWFAGVSGFSYHWRNWRTVKPYWRALISVAAKLTGAQQSCQMHPLPGDVFFFRNMERPLLGEGVGRQTNYHFRGLGWGWDLIPLCSYLPPLPTLLIYLCWVPEEVERREENTWFECLWPWMSDNRWVSVRQLW